MMQKQYTTGGGGMVQYGVWCIMAHGAVWCVVQQGVQCNLVWVQGCTQVRVMAKCLGGGEGAGKKGGVMLLALCMSFKMNFTDLSTPSVHLVFHGSEAIVSTCLLLMVLMSKAGSLPVFRIASCHSWWTWAW